LVGLCLKRGRTTTFLLVPVSASPISGQGLLFCARASQGSVWRGQTGNRATLVPFGPVWSCFGPRLFCLGFPSPCAVIMRRASALTQCFFTSSSLLTFFVCREMWLSVPLLVAALCSAGATTVWSGTYQTDKACNQTQCCCFSGVVTISQSGANLTGSTAIAGQCSGVSTLAFSQTLAFPASIAFVSSFSGQAFFVEKDGILLTLKNLGFPQCSGSATCTSGDCLGVSSSTCFHESTRISYKGGAPQTLSDFQRQASDDAKECHVPHVVRSSNGVRIETTCTSTSAPLRVTGDHLLYSARGLVAASLLVQGDILYADLAQLHECRILRVVHEDKEQLYFGLNCLESEVVADGYKASTFGHYHVIPSFWMKYVSKVVGVERASRWGDAAVQVLHKMNVF
jgi:hypothetical protein